jgi:hypothetical protein
MGPACRPRFRRPRRLRLTEKFRRVSQDSLEYYITIDDPLTWSRPWTFTLLLKKTGEGMFEYACHEGNYSLSGSATLIVGNRHEGRC